MESTSGKLRLAANNGQQCAVSDGQVIGFAYPIMPASGEIMFCSRPGFVGCSGFIPPNTEVVMHGNAITAEGSGADVEQREG